MNNAISCPSTILTLVLVLLLSGCASFSSDNYPTLKDTNDDVSTAMTPFRIAVDAGRATAGERQQGYAAFAKYKAAFDEALQDAQNNENTPTPKNVKALGNEPIRVLSSMPY
jgi:hypothetical protein